MFLFSILPIFFLPKPINYSHGAPGWAIGKLLLPFLALVHRFFA